MTVVIMIGGGGWENGGQYLIYRDHLLPILKAVSQERA